VRRDWKRARQELGFYVYADDKREMEEVVGELLKERGLKLAVAESCTGGLLSARLVNVPGSSQYFLGGFVVYSNELKTKLLSVEKELLQKHGAVSEEVCRAMCISALEETDADISIAITGIAGPSGATPTKARGSDLHSLEHRQGSYSGKALAQTWQERKPFFGNPTGFKPA
jgi:nicotinamide-nucleotide amidase